MCLSYHARSVFPIYITGKKPDKISQYKLLYSLSEFKYGLNWYFWPLVNFASSINGPKYSTESLRVLVNLRSTASPYDTVLDRFRAAAMERDCFRFVPISGVMAFILSMSVLYPYAILVLRLVVPWFTNSPFSAIDTSGAEVSFVSDWSSSSSCNKMELSNRLVYHWH